MERRWRERYPRKFRRTAVERMNNCESIVRLARGLGVNRRLLYKWRDQLDSPPQSEIAEKGRESSLRGENSTLKRLLAEKTVEIDFFKGALQTVEARRHNSNPSGEGASTMRSETPSQGSLSVERMCQLAQVSRAAFYRCLRSCAPVEESLTVRSAIQEIALEYRRRTTTIHAACTRR